MQRFHRTLPLALGLLAPLAGMAAANEIYVDSSAPFSPGFGTLALPYTSINAGIAAASSGDTINVFPGSGYSEQVVVNKNGIALQALPEATINFVPVASVEGFTLGTVYPGILIDSATTPVDDVSVRGFTISAQDDSQYTIGILASDSSAQFGGSSSGNTLSPEIVENTVVGCTYGVGAIAIGDGAVSGAAIHRNTVLGGLPGSANFCNEDRGAGIALVQLDGGRLDVDAAWNRVFGMESGTSVQTQNDEVLADVVVSRSNLAAFCGIGIQVNGLLSMISLNDTLALGSPSPFKSSVEGILDMTGIAQVEVYNSILWNPSSAAGSGTSPCDMPAPGDVQELSGVSSPVLHSTLLYTAAITTDDLFAKVTGPEYDFRLDGPSSPAVNAGTRNIGTPGAPVFIVGPNSQDPRLELPDDNNGGPRVLDALRNGVMEVDQGAFEYTPVGFEVTAAYGGSAPPAHAISSAYSDVAIDFDTTGALTFTLEGLAAAGAQPADAGVLLFAAPSSANTLLFPFGNQLVPFAGLVQISVPLNTPHPTDPTKVIGTRTLTTNGLTAETGLDVQTIFLRADPSFSFIEGNFGRRLRLEAND